MKCRLTFLWMLLAGMVMAQPKLTLKSGEELSDRKAYGRSTQQLEDFIRDNPSRLYDQSEALLLISYNDMQLGDYAGALAANAASLQLKAQLHADDLVNNYLRFGAIHLLRGNYHAALSYLLQAKNFPIEALQLYAVADGYLAAAYRGLGRFEEAESYYRQSVETLLIEYPSDHPDVINGFFQLGQMYVEWGKPEAGRRYFQQGLDRLSAASDPSPQQIALVIGLGDTHADQPRQAEGYYRQALALAERQFGAYHRETARSNIRLAGALYRQGRRKEAADAVHLAVRSLTPELPQLDWRQLPDLNTLTLDRALLAEALGFKARWLVDAAWPEDEKWPLAIAHSEAAAHLLTSAMEERIGRADRMELLPLARKAFEPGIEVALLKLKTGENADVQRRAFQLVEQLKVLEFNAFTARDIALSGSFVERERSLARELQLAQMDFREQPLDLTARQEVYRRREAWRQLLETWRQADPEAYRQRFGVSAGTLEDIRAGLTGGKTILSFFLGEKISCLFGLSREGLQLFPLSPGAADDAPAGWGEATAQFRQAIAGGEPDTFADLGDRLYRELLGPAADWIKGREHLIILPDGPLYRLPFEALLTRPYRKRRIAYSKMRYLIHDFAIQYQFLASDLGPRTGSRPAPDYDMLVLAPVFDRDDIAGVATSQRLLFDPELHPGSMITDGRRFPPLPQSVEEAEQLEALLAQSDKEGRFRWREVAGEDALKDEAGRPHYLHLATYAFVEGITPEETGLVLSNTDRVNESPEDGLLLASEWKLSALSATELVSIDRVMAAEGNLPNAIGGMRPLAGRMLLSGLSYVIYNTEPGSAAFFPAFYERLLDGRSTAEASRQAKRTLIRDKTTAAPHYWSGYRLVGN